MSVYIDRDQLENFAMNCVGGVVNMKQIHEFPAVHVPPHGRLIDANIPEDDREVYGFFNDYDLQQLLDSRPTIIPAEEGE